MTMYRLQREATSPDDAVSNQVADDYERRDGWEWGWPVTYVVEDDATGQRWTLNVECDWSPVFHTGRAVEVRI